MSIMASQIGFVTFGMFIIDEIEYLHEKTTTQKNLIGGAGVYAALGARLAAGPDQSKSVSWIVDMGSDFPTEFKDLISSWQTSCVFRTDHNRLTTRAWNGYGENQHRLFKYLTPKVRLEVPSLNDQQALSLSFHMVCSPSRSMELTRNLESRRKELNSACCKPIIIWEPIPDLCTPEELQGLQRAAQNVSVVSPNADELASFFAKQSIQSQDDMVIQFMGWDQNRALSTHAIIREGAKGSTIYFAPNSCPKSSFDRSNLHKLHLPAFHTEAEANRVTDPTGGGNTYLGGLAIGMTALLDSSIVTGNLSERLPELRIRGDNVNNNNNNNNSHQRVLIGALYGVIAASYAIEQSGVPSYSATSFDSAEKVDYWNGDRFARRMTKYIEREYDAIAQQLAQIPYMTEEKPINNEVV